MSPARHIAVRPTPEGRVGVFAAVRRRRTLLHDAADRLAALVWAAHALGLRVTVAVPRRGRVRPPRVFRLDDLAAAVDHSRRGAIPARSVSVRFASLPGSRIPRTHTTLRLPRAPRAELRRVLEEHVARQLASLSRHTGDVRFAAAA